MRKWSLLFSCMFLCILGCTTVPKEIVEEVTPTVTTQKEENTKKETIVTKGLCEVIETNEVAFADLYNEMNRIGAKNIFCIDETTGVVYFIIPKVEDMTIPKFI